MSRRIGLLSILLLTACLEVDSEEDTTDDPPGPQGQQEGDGGAAEEGDGGAGDGGAGEDGGAGDGGAEEDPGNPAEDCHPGVADWPDEWTAFEEQVVELTNEARAQRQDCGSYGSMPAVGPVEMDPTIQCAARYHSLWMEETGVFDHYSEGGDLGYSPWDRMANAGFAGSGVGENIAAGYTTAAQVVQGWLDSDGHCANLMSDDATLIGVGYAEGGEYGTWWTQDFGR